MRLIRAEAENNLDEDGDEERHHLLSGCGRIRIRIRIRINSS